ncbi:general stress protein [Pseudoxanthomonas helianthi]|uniref:General stress protein n=1 Tax=Pseudoxanthomonas helianthi TaxID=1453541 RepID=A0A940X171_9GAMM|nr:KGG domain-containing protein [Pseudoxanthomonas helianthi]MBP3983406.1 general stress protein [Pseudoxanthomonas helianthi]
MATNQNRNPQNARSGGRGFAGMDDQRQREIASKGGKAAHRSGNAHEFDSDEARRAGQKRGQMGNRREGE